MKQQLYKVLSAEMRSMHGGKHNWATSPTCTVTGKLVACTRGVHLCRPDDLIRWLGPVICPVTDYDAEGMLTENDKVVVRSATVGVPLATWNETTARLFACDVAQRSMRLHWKSDDTRPLDAIRVARRFAYGLATRAERDAAWAAARAAAGAAAWAAWWAAAGDAAMDAAGAAAGDAAMDAARDAARAAARAAAWDAAWDAAWAGITRRLFEYLDGAVTPESLRPTYEAHGWCDPLA